MLEFSLWLDSISFHAPNLDQAGSGNGLQEGPVRQGFFQISARQAGMFARQALRARAFAVFDGIEDRAVMFFREGKYFLRPLQGSVQEYAGAWGDEWEPIDLVDCAAKDLIVGEVSMASWKALFKSRKRVKLSRFIFENFFHGAIDFPQWFELSRIVQPFGSKPGSSAFQNPARLDRVPDIGDTELARGKSGIGQRLDQAFMLQFFESQAQRRAGNAELGGQRNLGNSLAGA